jgi:uncharacterized protein YwqG
MTGGMVKRLLALMTPTRVSKAKPTPASLGPLFAAVEERAQPCVRLSSTDIEASVRTRIGGNPSMKGRFEWPYWRDRPLGFVGQVELAEIRATLNLDWLPAEGRLLFFYDTEQGAWGFDPKDKGAWAVLFDPAEELAPQLTPPDGLPGHSQYLEKKLAAIAAQSYPSLERLGDSLGILSDDEWDALDTRFSCPAPAHQIGGYPSPIQGDNMELESQLASNGIYLGNAGGYNSPEVGALKGGAQDWVLLLQVDSDDDAGNMWGDSGMLYFWIRKQDAAKRDFSNVWMVLQCC